MAQTHDAAELRDGRGAGFDDSAALVDRAAGREQLEADERAGLGRGDRAIQTHEPTAAGAASILGVVGGDNAGFPNGRRVFDDVVSIELKAVAGALLGGVVKTYTPDAAAGLLFDVGSSEPKTVASLGAFGLRYRSDFPYLADPWDGYDNPATQVRAMAG